MPVVLLESTNSRVLLLRYWILTMSTVEHGARLYRLSFCFSNGGSPHLPPTYLSGQRTGTLSRVVEWY